MAVLFFPDTQGRLHARNNQPPWGFLGGSDDKESAYNEGDLVSVKKVKKILWRREWLPNPILENSMDRGAQWHCKELDMTE